jgi:hypothetical protein
VRGGRIGAGERRQHALILRPPVSGIAHQRVEIGGEIGLAVEVLDETPPPRRGQLERADKGGEQRHVAHADVGRLEAVLRTGLEPERQHLGVGRRLILAAEGLDAGLQELAGGGAALAEHRAEIAVGGGRAGRRRAQIVERHRDRKVGPKAQLAALRVAGEIHPPADVLAGEVEERLGRLQQLGRRTGVAGALEMGEERLGARIGSRQVGHLAHARGRSPKQLECGGL